VWIVKINQTKHLLMNLMSINLYMPFSVFESPECAVFMYNAFRAIYVDYFVCFTAKNPVPVHCPVAGKYNFTQRGDVPFETRILGGVTLSPRPNTYCKENISDFSVCDAEQKEIAIDETYCLSVDHLGRPVDIYSKYWDGVAHEMCCVDGHWKCEPSLF
jgi:hypothetical protein